MVLRGRQDLKVHKDRQALQVLLVQLAHKVLRGHRVSLDLQDLKGNRVHPVLLDHKVQLV